MDNSNLHIKYTQVQTECFICFVVKVMLCIISTKCVSLDLFYVCTLFRNMGFTSVPDNSKKKQWI